MQPTEIPHDFRITEEADASPALRECDAAAADPADSTRRRV
ncbi:MAG: hypothetical protein R3D80_06020 [Paracoccaceae bacterium]